MFLHPPSVHRAVRLRKTTAMRVRRQPDDNLRPPPDCPRGGEPVVHGVMRNMTHIFLNRLLSGGASYTLILPCARRSADAFTQETPRSKQVPLSYSSAAWEGVFRRQSSRDLTSALARTSRQLLKDAEPMSSRGALMRASKAEFSQGTLRSRPMARSEPLRLRLQLRTMYCGTMVMTLCMPTQQPPETSGPGWCAGRGVLTSRPASVRQASHLGPLGGPPFPAPP